MDETPKSEKEIILPFEGRKFDLGVWVYDHQVGICITLGIYLIATIALLFGYITLKERQRIEYIAVEMQTLAELQQQRDQLQESIEQIEKESAEIEDVSNRVSNENAETESVQEIHQNVQAMIDQAADIQRQMEANRASYEHGLAEVAEMKQQNESLESLADTTQTSREDKHVKGNVTVSYSLINPIRHATRLEVPAYLCEGGGEVTIQITVSRSGLVTNAKITKSANDPCIDQAALFAAERTEFKISNVAPTRHVGRITYIFIPQ